MKILSVVPLAVTAAAFLAVTAHAQDETTEGETNYKTFCFACHDTGAGGAPILSDAEAWAPRVAQGREHLYENAINGYTGESGVMPPKGGFAHLTDEQVKTIVDYMVDAQPSAEGETMESETTQ